MTDQIPFDDFAGFELEPEPEPAFELVESTVPALPLMQILPADAALPALVRFVPDLSYREAARQAADQALAVTVEGPEGLQRADVALTALRAAQSAITGHFEEPVAIAHALHKRLTTLRGEWTEPGDAALKTVGQRVWREQQRLERIAAETRRQAQEEANRRAREALAREAEQAAKAQAPPAVVETLRQQAETAQAPPVPVVDPTPALAHSTTTSTWKCRLQGTPADAEPNPATAELTPAQRATMLELLRAIVEGRAPLAAVEINWKAMNARAKAEKSAFAVPGLEAFEVGGLRAKPGRRR